MVKITKVYTKTGDAGSTKLAGQHIVVKNAARIIVMGECDELNAHIGFAIESMRAFALLQALQNKCLRIQHELFNFGAQLAVLAHDRRENTPLIQPKNVTQLEQEIDAMNDHLPILQSFILPGGCETSSRLHIARTVCRRAERSLVDFSMENALEAGQLPYLNRLSDWLFVAARHVIYQLNKKEILWDPSMV